MPVFVLVSRGAALRGLPQKSVLWTFTKPQCEWLTSSYLNLGVHFIHGNHAHNFSLKQD